MPELPDEMYCSEQICIPPTFPYLLRQYAKAAIRTQPSDLLRWSAAYFRCLALNIPPPVKPRLEYPIPRDHYGLTPGWMKALLYQLPQPKTVNFKILWDRWIGACLKHETLIEILCLAGFDDPFAIPFLRFVAICVAHLTDNLTQTMIMICETLTEEPEGGSSMIMLETFVDLYRFLAAIDASQPQTLKNLYFTDALLGLCPESEEKVAKEVEEEAPQELPEESVEIEEAPEEAPEALPAEEDVGVVISCPDIQADDFQPGDLEKYELGEEKKKSKETIADEYMKREEAICKKTDEEFSTAGENLVSETTSDLSVPTVTNVDTAVDNAVKAVEPVTTKVQEIFTAPPVAIQEEAPDPLSRDTIIGFNHIPGHKTTQEEAKEEEDEEDLFHSDLERLKAAQRQGEQDEERAPSVDEDIEIFKKVLYAEQVPITAELGHYVDVPSSAMLEKEVVAGVEKATLLEDEQASLKIYEEVHVDAVPGIGGIVPETLVEAVVKYMREMAVAQHGMVMTRNIRHYRCPPLESVTE